MMCFSFGVLLISQFWIGPTGKELSSQRLLQGRDTVNVSWELDPLACPSKLLEMEPDKPNMANVYVVDRAIDDAAFILERNDQRWVTT